MKFIVIPTSKLLGKEKQLKELGLEPRKSVNGLETILHLGHYESIFPQVELQNIVKSKISLPYIYPTYNHPSGELNSLLSSRDWEIIK